MRVDNNTRYSTEDLKALFAECLRRMQQEGFPNGRSRLRSAGLTVSFSYTTSTVHFMTSVSVPGARHVDLRIGRPERFRPSMVMDSAPKAIAAEFIFGKRVVSAEKDVAHCEKNLRKAKTRARLAATLLKNRQKDLKQAVRRLEREKTKTADMMNLLPHEEITLRSAQEGA